MGINKIIKLFKKGNVCVVGLRGCGKDMLFANVIARRKEIYISNTDYHCKKSVYLPLRFDKLNIKNNYKNFIADDIVPYDYPYPQGADIYVADCGIYLPSQYCNELNKQFPEFTAFYCLTRHLYNGNFHTNVQSLNRIWDKLREQSDIYLRCTFCKVLFRKWVVQRVVEYDKYQACVDRVEPYAPIRIPLMCSKEMRASLRQKDEEMYRLFKEKNGKVKSHLLIYKNKSKYDTRLFKGVLSREN